MPMPNLRHHIKSGKKERRTGTVTPALDRCFLPKIVPKAPFYQEHGQTNKACVPSAFVKLPAIPGSKADTAKKTTKPSGLPVLVDPRFKDLPKCGQVVPKVTEMLTRRPNRLGYDRASDDNIHKSDVDAVADPSCVAYSWQTDSMAEDKRKRIEKYAKLFDVYVRETAEAMERERQEAIRRERIEKYAAIFDVYVKETAEAMERERQEAIRRERIEKYAAIFDVYVTETAEAMERERQEEIRRERIEKYAAIFDVYVTETAEAMEREKQRGI